jgi:hypothetical protein
VNSHRIQARLTRNSALLGAGGGGQIEEAVFVTANLSVTPPIGNFGPYLTFDGGGFAPGENIWVYVGGVGSDVLTSGVAEACGSLTATARPNRSRVRDFSWA